MNQALSYHPKGYIDTLSINEGRDFDGLESAAVFANKQFNKLYVHIKFVIINDSVNLSWKFLQPTGQIGKLV